MITSHSFEMFFTLACVCFFNYYYFNKLCVNASNVTISVYFCGTSTDLQAGESGKAALAIDLRFFLHNLKSRGPSSVQAKGFRATVIMIHFVNKALHKDKTAKAIHVRCRWFDSEQCVLATLRPFSQVE